MASLSSLMGPTTATATATGKVFVGTPKRRSLFMNSMNSSSSIGMATSRSRIEAVMTASRVSIYPSIMSNLSPLIRSGSAVVFDYKRMIEEEDEMKKNKRNESLTAEKLDEWIRESIGEIVRDIGEAPFLVQIFSQGPSSLRLEKEKASPESWPLVKKRWDQSNCKPDGVILVEELKDEEEEEKEEEEEEEDDAPTSNNGNDSSNKTWGLVVQGRGKDCAASCYILNTCRVKSAGGFCTHFCLVRAKCFGETLDKQLKKAWLQGR